MTSQQLSKIVNQLEVNNAGMQVLLLAEIAYQLAVANEM